MKSDAVYLHHVLDALRQIEDYMDGISLDVFLSDRMRQDAVVRQLEIIGEACRQLSDALRARHPDVPWRAIIGMRNRIAHDYLNIDLHVIWDVVQVDLPSLKTSIERILGL
ncbi:MAG: DUF86 domain-containing protein [Alphaproteobacteria bacterium]|nr:MAG: DUF86 domain-containing protein [Alphaproteobacteria bacterium]